MGNNPENTIIDLRDAVLAARKYFDDLFSEEHYTNVRLEEVALSDDSNIWSITLGFDLPPVRDSSYTTLIEMGIGPKRLVREYKSFEIDAHNGFVKSMKIRKV